MLPLLFADHEPRAPDPQGRACAYVFVRACEMSSTCVTFRPQFLHIYGTYGGGGIVFLGSHLKNHCS